MKRFIFNILTLLSAVMIIVVIWLWLWAYYRPIRHSGTLRFSNYKVVSSFDTTRFGRVELGIRTVHKPPYATMIRRERLSTQFLFGFRLRVMSYSWGTSIWFHIPYWFLLIVFAIPPVIWLHKCIRRKSSLEHCCPNCQYDLRGTIAAGRSQCPECGAAIPQITKVS